MASSAIFRAGLIVCMSSPGTSSGCCNSTKMIASWFLFRARRSCSSVPPSRPFHPQQRGRHRRRASRSWAGLIDKRDLVAARGQEERRWLARNDDHHRQRECRCGGLVHAADPLDSGRRTKRCFTAANFCRIRRRGFRRSCARSTSQARSPAVSLIERVEIVFSSSSSNAVPGIGIDTSTSAFPISAVLGSLSAGSCQFSMASISFTARSMIRWSGTWSARTQRRSASDRGASTSSFSASECTILGMCFGRRRSRLAPANR